MKKLTKTQQAILAMFATKANEDGRVLVFTTRECVAAHKLAAAGIVTVTMIETPGSRTKLYNFGRDRDYTTYTCYAAAVRLVKESN